MWQNGAVVNFVQIDNKTQGENQKTQPSEIAQQTDVRKARRILIFSFKTKKLRSEFGGKGILTRIFQIPREICDFFLSFHLFLEFFLSFHFIYSTERKSKICNFLSEQIKWNWTNIKITLEQKTINIPKKLVQSFGPPTHFCGRPNGLGRRKGDDQGRMRDRKDNRTPKHMSVRGGRVLCSAGS